MAELAADQEIELKLLVDRDHLPRLAERFTSRGWRLQRKQLESRYYDTPDRRLSARGVALRVRRSGDRFIQTLKSKDTSSGAHSVRGEWEAMVADMTPRLDQISDPAALDRLGMVLPEELEPVFVTNIDRQQTLIEQEVPDATPAIIELAFDQGSIDTAEASEPITEVELELKAGSPRGMYELLRELREVAPLEIAVTNKAQRGHRLATGAPPTAVKAARPKLQRELPLDRAIAVVMGNCLGQWLENIAPARDGRDVEGVHQLRIAVRRCRSALLLFAPGIDDTARRGLNERLKAVVAASGPARELDVFLTETIDVLQQVALPEDRPALAALERAARSAQAAAYDHLRTFLDSRAHADLVLDLAEWVALEGWRENASAERLKALQQPTVELATRLLERRHKRVRKLGKHFEMLPDEQRHDVRLALKKLRYGVEFLSGLFDAKPAKRYGKAAAALQDVLGQLNDQIESHNLLQRLSTKGRDLPATERLQLERGIGFVLGWQTQGMAEQRREAEQAWRGFVAERPFWHD